MSSTVIRDRPNAWTASKAASRIRSRVVLWSSAVVVAMSRVTLERMPSHRQPTVNRRVGGAPASHYSFGTDGSSRGTRVQAAAPRRPTPHGHTDTRRLSAAEGGARREEDGGSGAYRGAPE